MLHAILQFNLTQWVSTMGYIGILFIVFCETGLFFGCFFPGDSLLFTAGLLAMQGIFNIYSLLCSVVVAAVLGYACGYWFGAKLGMWLLQRSEGFFFKKRYLQQAHDFYARYGFAAMILCRLVPVVRTFCPIIAGMGSMCFKRYMLCNVIGAVIWVSLLMLLGYFVGALFPRAPHFILPIVLGIIFISILPAMVHFLKQRRSIKQLPL